MPVHEIKLLSLIDIELESSFLVLARNMGIRTVAPDVGRADPRQSRSGRSSWTPAPATRRSWSACT